MTKWNIQPPYVLDFGKWIWKRMGDRKLRQAPQQKQKREKETTTKHGNYHSFPIVFHHACALSLQARLQDLVPWPQGRDVVECFGDVTLPTSTSQD